MDPEVARVVLYGTIALGAVVWLVGARFLINSYRTPHPAAAERLSFAEPAAVGMVRGSAELDGQPADMAARAAAALAAGTVVPFGLVKIVDRREDFVAFEGVAPLEYGQRQGARVRRGEFRFVALNSRRTRIEYVVELPHGLGLLWGGVAFQVLGLAALVASFLVFQYYVVDNPDPGIRWQTFQALQVSHFLWPPFLFAALYRKRYSGVRSALDALAHNLPHLNSQVPN